MQKEVRQSKSFRQSPEEVWDYLTKPELLEIWLMKSDFKPVVGHKFSFICSVLNECVVLEVSPFTRLAYSWRTDSAVKGKIIDSKVLWTLVPKGMGTELQLTHDGFEVLEDSLAHNTGWTKCLTRLEEAFTKQPADAKAEFNG